MVVFGMSESMFLVFVATVFAGSLGAIHYVFVHVFLGKPVGEIPGDSPPEGHDSVKDQAVEGGSTDGGR